MASDKRDQLYTNLIGSGKVSEDEIGSLDEFKKAIKDEQSSREFYRNLSATGLFNEDEIGSEDDFYGSISDDFAKPSTGSVLQKSLGQRTDPYSQVEKSGQVKSDLEKKKAQRYTPSPSEMAGFNQTVANINRGVDAGMQRFDRRAQNLQKRQGLSVPQRINLGESNNLRQGEQYLNPETGQLENTYITSSGNEYDSKAMAEQEQQQLDEEARIRQWRKEHPKDALGQDINEQIANLEKQREAIMQKGMEEAKQEVEQSPGIRGTIDRFLAGRSNVGPFGPNRAYAERAAVKHQDELSAIEVALQDLKDAKTRIERSTQLEASSDFLGGIGVPFTKDWFNNWKNFGYGVWDAMDNLAFNYTGSRDINKANMYLRIKNKIEKGEELTDQETAVALAGMSLAQAQQVAELPHGYTAGETTLNMAPFMFQMAGNPASGTGKAFARQAVRKFGRDGIKAVSTRVGARVLGNIAEGTVLANTLQAPATIANVMQRYTGDSFEYGDDGKLKIGYYDTDKDGNPVFVEGGKGVARSIWEGEASQIIENFTELGFGGNISKFLGKIASSGVGQKMGLGYLSDLVGKIGATPFARNMKNFMERTHWDGMIEEPLEEEYGIILNSLLTGDNSLSDLWDSEQQMDIFAGTMWFGGMLAAMNTAAYPYYRRKVKQQLNQADVFGQVSFGDEWAVIKDGIDEMPDNEIANYLYDIKDNDIFSNDQKAALFAYVSRLKQYQGASTADMLMRIEGNLSKEETDVRNAYDKGTELTEPKDMNEAKMMMDYQHNRLSEIASDMIVEEFENNPLGALQGIINSEYWTDEEKQVAMNYVNARMTYEGMIDRVNDDIDSQIAASDAMIDKRANRENPSVVIPATLTDDRQVSIVSGNVVMLDDGSGVDRQASIEANDGDGMILTVDDSGKVEAHSLEDFRSVDEAIPVQQMKDEAAANIRQITSQTAADNIDGVLPFAQGDQYTILGEDGQQHSVEVFEDQGDGTVAVFMDGTPQAVVMPKEQLQAMNDAYLQDQLIQQEEQNQLQNAQAQHQNTQGAEAAGEAGQELTGGNEPAASALSRIPVRMGENGQPMKSKNGRPILDWHKVSVEDATDALIESTEGNMLDARNTANDLAGQAKDKLEKIRKQKPKGEDPIEMAESRVAIRHAEEEQQAIIKQWQNVAQEIKRRMDAEAAERQAAIEAAKSEEQRQREAEEARQRKEQQDEQDRQRLREQIEKDKKARSKEYEPLVKARKEMAGDADAMDVLNDTEPRSLEEWVSSLLSPHSFLWLDASESERGLQTELGLKRADMQRFMTLFGTKENDAMPFGKAVLDIYEALPESMKNMYTDEDVARVVRDMFQSMENSAQMMHLTELNRIEQARQVMQENERREEEAEMEAWAEAYHLTPEERETFEDFLQQQASEEEQEIINNIIADESYRTSTAMDQQPVSGTAAAGTEGSEGQVQQTAEATGTGTDEEAADQGAEAQTGQPPVADNNVPGRTQSVDREALRELFRQIGADEALADRISDYDVEQLTAMVEDWEAHNDDYGYVMEQQKDALKSKDKKVRDEAQKKVDEAQQVANEAFVPIEEYIEGLNVKYGIESEEPFEGAIPTPKIDKPRYDANRRALIDAYKSGDPAAITAAAQAIQQFVDEGLDAGEDNTGMFDVAEDYDGNDPEKLADQYIIRTFWDRYVDDDADQEYIKTGLKPSMRNDNKFVGKFEANEVGVCTNPNVITYHKNPKNVNVGFEIRTAQTNKGWVGGCDAGGPTYGYGSPVTAGANDLYFETEQECQSYWAQHVLDYLESHHDKEAKNDPMAAYKAELRKIIGKSPVKQSEQLKPTDLRDVVRAESPEIGVNEANARAREAAGMEDQEVETTINSMKSHASVAPSVEITDENWQDNVETPIGNVKMGENQRQKMFVKGREQQYGMLLETLSSPDIVLEEQDKESDMFHERSSSYLFIKTFIKPDGSKFVHFESVTVSQDGMEVSISSHIIRENQLKNKLKSDRLLYKATALDEPANSSAEQPTSEGSGLSSEGKDKKNISNKQEKTKKSSIQGLEDYSEEEIKNFVRNFVNEQIELSDADAEIVDIAIIGSRANGTAKPDSDLDVLVEYKGKEREDDLFNTLNDADEPLVINGIRVDINPITEGKSGTIAEFLERNKDYKKENTTPIGTTFTPEQIAAEEAKVDTNPSEAQKEAGNYQKGHIMVDGYDITIENPKGSVRRGTDANGKQWEQEMHNTYGYIKGTEGVDGDHIDVFLSDNPASGKVWVVDQVNKDGSFDEHKVMYGFANVADATKAYLSNYEEGWQGLGAISGISREEFKKWIESSHRKTKPFREYALAKSAEAKEKKNVSKPAKEHKRIVSDEKMEELRKQLLAKFNNMNEGIDVERMLLGAMYAVGKIERGVTKFADYATQMVDEIGDAIRPYLKAFYEAVRNMPEAAPYRDQMTPADEVAAFDEYNFDKQRQPDVFTKAEQVVKKSKAKQQVKKIEKEVNQKLQQGDLFAGDLFGEPEPAKEKTKAQEPAKHKEPKLRPATEADLESEHPIVYLNGHPYNIIAVMRSGEQISATQFSKPKVDSVMLTNGKSVKLEDLMVEDENAGKEKPKPKTPWWSDPNRPKDLNPKDHKTYTTNEAKDYFAKYVGPVNEKGKHFPDFTKWAHPNLAYITAAAWDGAGIPLEELQAIPEIKEADDRIKSVSGSLVLTDEEMLQHANHLLDAEHGSAVFVNGKKDKGNYSGPVRQERKALIVIGKPAGGKSSVFADRLSYDFGARIVDSDTVKPWLEGFDDGYGAGYVHDASAHVADMALDMAAERGDNMIIPRIGGESVVTKLAVPRLIEKGYDVQLYFNDVSEQTSIMRAASRFAEEGRYLSLDYLTTINDKDYKTFINFAEKKLGDYYGEKRNAERPADGSESTPSSVLADGGSNGQGKQPSRSGESGSVSQLANEGGQLRLEPSSTQGNKQVADGTRVFSYAEWKSNDVGYGEAPKEIWNSKSGTPLSDVIKQQNNGRKRERTPEADRMQRQGDSPRGAEGANRQSSSGISSGESTGSRTADQGRLGSGVQERGDERQGDSGIQEAEPANSRTSESVGRQSGAVQQLEPKNLRNNHAERGKDYAPKGVDARIDANIKAIELMQQLIESGEVATPEQMAVLRKYSGWGGLGKAFDDEAYANRLRELLGEDAYQEAVMSRNSAYFTPAMIIDTMWDVAKAMGFKGGNVLEGSAGIGNIIGLMPTDMSERSNIRAVEIDSTTGNILKLLYPDAQVDIQGFENTRVENGSVDLAITNVPFVTGLRVMDTTGDKDLSKKFHDIHDFCIAKNIRKLKEGGIGIFISSSGTLDNSKALRDWIVSEGNTDVVGAFRLNNETFGGTGATSDIIVVRKRVNGKTSANSIDVSVTSAERTAEYNTGEEKKVKGQWVSVVKQLSMDYNKYLVEHPDMMGGKMYFGFEKGDNYRPTSKALYPEKGIDQSQRLQEWADSFEGKDWEKPAADATGTVTDTVYEDLGADIKEGSMLIDGQGRLCVAQFGKAVPLTINDNKVKGHTKQECFKSYQNIKQALSDVLAYQTEHDDNDGLQSLLDKLNKAFDSFVNTYGHLHKNNQLAFLKNDIDYPNVFALETYSETGDPKTGKRIQNFGKTDIFKKRVVEKEKTPHPDNVKDALIASIYRSNGIDLDWIAEKLNESDVKLPSGNEWTREDVRKGILVSGLGFENPDTRAVEVAYEYLSGNVRQKLQQAIDNNQDGRYDANIRALEKVMPMTIPAHLIDFSIGSSWIDPKLYEEYVKEKTDIDVQFTPAGGTWYMKNPYYIGEQKNRAMGVTSEMLHKTIFGTDLIEAAMTNKTITVSETRKKWDGSTETTVDKEATQACANKIDEIRQDFKDWAKAKMQASPEMAQKVEKQYNDQFNNYVPKSIPDEFVPQHFTGASIVYTLQPHQAKAAIRATTQPLLLAHEVGSGKTFTLITAAMEMRRLGTARKPMIVVQNATLAQFVSDAKALYPNAKVLTLDDKDHTAEGRKNFYARIKYNDWDLIVVPQSVFERIPDSEERQMAYIRDKIQEKLLVLEQMKDVDKQGNSAIVRQAEKEIEKLQDSLVDLSAAIADKRKKRDEKKAAVTRQNAEVKAKEMLDRQTDDVENFDDMGIDALLVDEAHEYKHLGFATAMQRGVKGVDPSYSKKAQGVYLKTQAVLEKNNGRNVVFATGTPISNTAAEIWTFMRYLMPADTMKDYGIYYFDDFVRNFGNLTQMLEFTTSGKFKENNRFAGYINLPELVRIWSSVADTVLNKEIEKQRQERGEEAKIPKLEGDKEQDIYLSQSKALRSVMKYVKSELERYENMSGKEKKENSHIPLTMYGIAKAAAVDARLVVDDAADEPQSKTNEAVRQTLKSLEETKGYKGTVALFADNYQNKRSGFNLYEDIRKKLIEAGVPAEQVAIIKSGMTIKKKQEIFDKVNSGEIRVIMGSTFTLGTGVNIQERLHTLIHLDAPNRPMDYTQRNGRILRQGNLHKQMDIPVRVLRFGVEDSLDVTAYQRLKTKGAIADSIMHGQQMMANSMENRALEEEEDVFGDTVAQLSGSEYAMLKNQAEKDVRKYEAKKKQYEADQAYCHSEIPRLESEIDKMQKYLKRVEDDLATVEKLPAEKTITIGKQKFADMGSMTDFFKEYNKKIKEVENELRDNPSLQAQTRELTVNVAGIDFKFITDLSVEVREVGVSLFTAIHRSMTYSCEQLGIVDRSVHQALLRNGIEDIMNNVVSGADFRRGKTWAREEIEKLNKQLSQVKERYGKPFEYTEELKKSHERYDEYSELMKKELEEKEKKYAEMDKDVEAAVDVENAEEAEEETEDEDLYRYGDEDEDVLLAPNGKPSNLSPYLWSLVRTPEFKEWFGDWENDPENASKVVDENGEPKVMYHKTNLNVVNKGVPFYIFYEDSHFGTLGQANDRVRSNDEGVKTYEVFLNIRNPQRRNDADEDYLEDKDMTMSEFWQQSADRAKSQGHDGIVYLNEYEDKEHPADSWIAFRPEQVKSATDNNGAFDSFNPDIRYRIREDEPPKKTGIGYKVFVLKDGQLYPPMVANPNGAATPVGEWLDADAAPIAGTSKTGRPQVKAGGKGTQGGSGQLAYRPGWHLGTIPYALQFNRKDENGERTLFPKNFVWAEVEYADDVDYQQEAHDAGVNENGKYQHSLAGLKYVPVDGSYRYRTNPDPNTDEWIITGAMKVNRILKPSEVDEMVRAAGREPQPRQEGAVTDAEVEALNAEIGTFDREGNPASAQQRTRQLTAKEQKDREDFARRQWRRAHEVANQTVDVLKLNDRVQVFDSIDDVPGNEKFSEKKRRAKGWYNRSDDKIYIVLGNHNSPSDVRTTILHEAVAHYGLRQLFGKNFDQFLDNVYRLADSDTRAKIVELAKKHKWDFHTATEEYLARLAEDTDFQRAMDSGWWQRIKEAFLNMLKKVGLADFDTELTDNELRYILWRSYENLAEPGHYRNVFAEAKDVAMQAHLNVGNYNKERDRIQKTGRMDTGLYNPDKQAPMAAEAKEVAMYKEADHLIDSVKAHNPTNFKEEKSISDRVKELPENQLKYAYKKVNSQMLDENGLNIDEHSEKVKQDWREKHGLGGLGKVAADDLKALAEKYGWGMLTLRWELLDRLEQLDMMDPDLYREGDEPAEPTSIARSIYEDAVKATGNATMVSALFNAILNGKKGWEQFKHQFSESWFDYSRSIKALQDAIEKATGKAVAGFEDVWRSLNAKSSIDNIELQEVMRQYIEPLSEYVGNIIKGKKIDGKAVTIDDVEKYLNAVHGQERNVAMAMKQAQEEYDEDTLLLRKQLENASLSPAERTSIEESLLRKEARFKGIKDYMGYPSIAKWWHDWNMSVERGHNNGTLSDEEYNKVRAKMETEYNQGWQYKYRNKDYSGLTALFADDFAEDEDVTESMLEQAARDYAAMFEDVIGKAETDELWERVKALNNYSLRKSYLSGLISKQQYDDTLSMYEHYVPLRGWHDDYAGDVYQYISRGEPAEVLQGVLKKAYGRKSRAARIFGTMAAMANTAIVQGNKNTVAQKLLNLAMNHTDAGLLMVTEQWYRKDANDNLVPEFPNLREDMTAEEMQEEIERFEADMKEREERGEVETLRKKFKKEMPLNMAKWQEQRHAVRVLRNGKEYMVYVLGDPRAAEAFNGLLNPHSQPGAISNVLSRYMRFRAKWQTSLSPEFLISNFQRDVTTATTGAYVKFGKETSKQFAKNLAKVMPMTSVKKLRNTHNTQNLGGIFSLLRKYDQGTLNHDDDMERYFDEFVRNGGMTGISYITRSEEYQASMEDMVKRMRQGKLAKPRQWAEAVGNAVEFANKGIENATRFAMFVTSRQQGKTIVQSIFDAKEASVNFNMKGSGAWGNMMARRLYLYVNPAMQALRMLGTWYENDPMVATKESAEIVTKAVGKRFMKAAAFTLSASIGTAVLNIMLSALLGHGDDDDDNVMPTDWWSLSEWNRYNYVNIVNPLGKGYFHWNLPQELRPIWAMGQIAVDGAFGKITPQHGFNAMLSQLNNITPLSFFEGGTTADNSTISSLIRTFTPTFVGEFTDAYGWNRDFMGHWITNQSSWNEDAPEWQRASEGTPKWIVGLSKQLNDMAPNGRTNNRSDWESRYLNPSAVYYILTQQYGGMGTMSKRLYQLIEQAADPEQDMEIRNVPFIPKFYVSTGDDYSSNRVMNEKFRMYWDEYKATDSELARDRKAVKDGSMSQEDADKTIEERKNDGSYQSWKAVHDNYLNKLYEEVRGTKEANKVKQMIVDAIEHGKAPDFTGMDGKIYENAIKRQKTSQIDDMSNEEMQQAFNESTDSQMRSLIAKRIAKSAGASKDVYGEKSSVEYANIYQELRTANDVYEDALLYGYYEQAKDSGNDELKEQIRTERDLIRQYAKDLDRQYPADNASIMEDIRSERSTLIRRLHNMGIGNR